MDKKQLWHVQSVSHIITWPHVLLQDFYRNSLYNRVTAKYEWALNLVTYVFAYITQSDIVIKYLYIIYLFI